MRLLADLVGIYSNAFAVEHVPLKSIKMTARLLDPEVTLLRASMEGAQRAEQEGRGARSSCPPGVSVRPSLLPCSLGLSFAPALLRGLILFLLFRFKGRRGFPRTSWESRNSWIQRRARIHGSSRATGTAGVARSTRPPHRGTQGRPRPAGTTRPAR